MSEIDQNFWRKCGSCKKEIHFGSEYQVCGSSSCQKFAYCSIDCWSLHNSIMNHKNGWSEDRIAPLKDNAPVKRLIITPKSPTTTNEVEVNKALENEILIVASKLKQYIKDKHDLNTSADVMEILSTKVRRLTDQAVIKAKSDNRKTLMGRDF
jgi:hypothetical protein